jgi:antitoxin component YwqK of YwqJK toxin-antitoxin module
MKNFYLLLILVFFSGTVLAQKLPDNGFNRIRINRPDENLQLEIIPLNHLPDPDIDKTYYWYAANDVHQTRGGYSGQLLNGKFMTFFLNKNLKEQVLFTAGLPDGQWKQWYETGSLKAVVTWNNGMKQGPYILYDTAGRKQEEGSYAGGLRHGKITMYLAADSVKVQRYRKGLPVPEKKPIWKRLLFFKKKHTTPQP